MHPLLDSTARPVVGHRGNAAHAPENTLESFRQGVALGVDAIELDVRLSGDGHVVVIHDATVDRTTDGSGRVSHSSLDSLRRVDAGARFTPDSGKTYPYRRGGLTIPTFAEVLSAFPSLPLLIEIKTLDTALPTRRLIEAHGAEDRCIVASFDDDVAPAFTGSGIVVGASTADVRRLYLPALFGARRTRASFGVVCIPTHYRHLPLPIRGLVRLLEPARVNVHIWTVNDPNRARRLWKKGVRGIISDDPETIIQERDRDRSRAGIIAPSR
jgi:glycerophosphoryl diester phosphodiesterase